MLDLIKELEILFYFKIRETCDNERQIDEREKKWTERIRRVNYNQCLEEIGSWAKWKWCKKIYKIDKVENVENENNKYLESFPEIKYTVSEI